MRIALIDGDVIAYRASCAVEVATQWEPGYWTWHCDETDVKRAIRDEIDRVMAKLDAHEYRVCLTTPTDVPNFRLGVLPTYKGKRSNIRKPLVLKPVRQWLIEGKYKALVRPTLEGDDVMGILATWPGLKGEKIIVSIDKDMKTIPGLYLRELDDDVVSIDEDEANAQHMLQTLMGDATDGYTGIPRVGPKKAEAILADATADASPQNYWADVWKAVVRAYADKQLGEEEALRQARVARILRASDYDFKTKRPILWTPPSS
jgi:DNA polymerase-1